MEEIQFLKKNYLIAAINYKIYIFLIFYFNKNK